MHGYLLQYLVYAYIRNVISMILTGTYEEMEELESLKIATNDPTAAHGRCMYYYRYMYRHSHIIILEKKNQKKCTTGQKRFKSDETNGNDKRRGRRIEERYNMHATVLL